MDLKRLFKDGFDILREQIKKVDTFDVKKQEILSKSNIYSQEHINKLLEDAAVSALSEAHGNAEKLTELFENIKTELLSQRIDMSDIALNNALTSINLADLDYSPLQEQIAESFKGNLPAMRLIESAASQKGYKDNVFKKYVFEPEIKFSELQSRIDTAFRTSSGMTKQYPAADIKSGCVKIAQELARLSDILGLDISTDEKTVIDDMESYLFLSGFEHGIKG